MTRHQQRCACSLIYTTAGVAIFLLLMFAAAWA